MTAATTSSRRTRTKAIAAIATGALLLTGGTTFALWSQQATIPGGSITAGNLAVSTADGTWQDVSPEHTEPIAISDLSAFRAVPGDVLQGSYPVDVAALGDNFVAELTVAFAGASGDLLAEAEGVSLAYALFDKNGDQVGTDGSVSVLSDGSTVNKPGAIVADNVSDGTDPELKAVVTATFDSSTPDRVRAATQALLGDLTVTLTQTR